MEEADEGVGLACDAQDDAQDDTLALPVRPAAVRASPGSWATNG